eukprot:1227024-Prymnesium_polylepis.1
MRDVPLPATADRTSDRRCMYTLHTHHTHAPRRRPLYKARSRGRGAACGGGRGDAARAPREPRR